MIKEFMKGIYASVAEDNLNIYKELFEAKSDANTIDYWKKARALYGTLGDEGKAILFDIIKTVAVDTISTVLGILDGVVSIDENEWTLHLSINGLATDGELQDTFLAYVEELEERCQPC